MAFIKDKATCIECLLQCSCFELPMEERLTGHHPNCDLWDPHAAEVE